MGGLIEREVATDESSGAQADSQGYDLTAVLREAHALREADGGPVSSK
jgi:hypothetical protein